MKKNSENGSHYITFDEGEKFINSTKAIQAMQMMEMVYALQGYLTTTYISLENRKVELTVHFSSKAFPTLSQGFKFTRKEIHSHTYWCETTSQMERVRTVDYQFEYDK